MTDQKRRGLIEVLLWLAATGVFSAYLVFVPPTVLESSDYVFMWKPIWHFLRSSLHEGTIPLWNPYIELGRPFFADVQNAVCYPPLYLICLGPRLGVFVLIWLHCLLSVYGSKFLADALKVGAAQGNFMALCFLGSGAITARWATGQLPYCWALCYAPWLFYFAVRTAEPWNLRRVAAYELTLAAAFFCGNPQVFWFLTIGQGAFILGRSIKFPVGDAIADLLRGISQFGVALLWCVGLVAIVLLPFMELVGQGNRNSPTPALANFLKMDWWHFASLVTPVGLTSRNPTHYWEMNLFVGWIVLILGVGGLCRVREPNVRGLLAMSALGLFLAVGSSTPVFEFFYRCLPGFASLRAHAREGFLISFALICAAGIWLSRPHPALRGLWARRIRIPLLYLFLGLFLLQTADLVRATRQIKNTYTFAKVSGKPPDFPYEFVLEDKLRAAGFMQDGESPPRVCVPPELIPANFAMIHRYSTFDADFSLFLRRDWDYLHQMLELKPSEVINTRLPNIVYQHGPFPYADLSLSAGINPVDKSLLMVTNTSPRAFLIYAAEVVPDYNAILKRLAAGHDIQKRALLENPLGSLRADNPRPPSLAKIHDFKSDSFLVDVDAKEDALLVVTESWYPGWRAESGGRIYESVPVNACMRGIFVEAGRRQIRFYFHQNYLLSGSFISCVSGILLLVVFARGKRKQSSPA